MTSAPANNDAIVEFSISIFSACVKKLKEKTLEDGFTEADAIEDHSRLYSGYIKLQDGDLKINVVVNSIVGRKSNDAIIGSTVTEQNGEIKLDLYINGTLSIRELESRKRSAVEQLSIRIAKRINKLANEQPVFKDADYSKATDEAISIALKRIEDLDHQNLTTEMLLDVTLENDFLAFLSKRFSLQEMGIITKVVYTTLADANLP